MFRAVDSEDISRSTSPTSTQSPPRDGEEPLDGAQTPTAQNRGRRELSRNMIIKELLICIVFAVTTFGALHNSHTKISKHPQAKRFFSRHSPVKDWYQGQLNAALEIINQADISFVMYYAPWDAECQYVRKEFEKAALVLGDKVYFAAINCWNPGSECKLTHSKIPSWPIIMAYSVTSRGIVYKGPRDAQSMINFLQLIMRPLKRISNSEDLVNLLSICDAVAVGYTPLSERSKHYNVWYEVALKVREFDTIGEICFGVVTSEELTADLGVDVVPNARMMLWNNTVEFRHDLLSWNSSSLLNWVLENFTQPVSRIIPMWKKAFSFEKFIDGNPILLLFTPMNPLYELIPNYALLREVAMEYYNCKNNESSQWITELIKLQQVQRLVYQQRNVKKFCQDYKFKKVPNQNLYETSQFKYPWHNSTKKNKKVIADVLVKRGLGLSAFAGSTEKIAPDIDLTSECSNVLFPAQKDFYNIYEQCHSGENLDDEAQILAKNFDTSMLPIKDDPRSPENLVQDHVKQYCKVMDFAHKVSPPIYPAKEELNTTSIVGLACKRNFTLYIVAVDSMRNFHFAESLGINISKKKDMTAVVILDVKRETQHVLTQEFNAKSIREFIYNFTTSGLKRYLRSHVEDAAHTHYFSLHSESQVHNDTYIYMEELTTRSFKKLVNTPGQVSIVSVCGGSCDALISRAMLSAARLLRRCGVATSVATLDALRHDLPWHYAPHLYPAIMFFPPHRGREAESYRPPFGERISASSLVAVALRAIGPPPLNLRVRLQLCHTAKWNTEQKSCLHEIRELMTSLLQRNLDYYRRSENQVLRNSLFQRIIHLHRVFFELSLMHYSDLRNNSYKQQRLLDSLDSLGRNWEIDTTTIINSSKVKS